MDLPYVVQIGGGRVVALELPAAWLKSDRAGQPLLRPEAVRAVDRLRATFDREAGVTPGFIVSLREAMGLSQEAFGSALGVSKMTVSRWECGRMLPSASARLAIMKQQTKARRTGVRIDDGEAIGR